VITVTRLNGPQFAVNPDLIQRIETTPDTILTLIDGSKYVIAESTDEVTDRIITYRATVVARTMQFAEQDERMGDMTVAAVTQLRPTPGAPRGLTAVPEAD
jgi:flagellar protein FlbD